MRQDDIKTYSTETFRDKFMKLLEKLDTFYKAGFGKFFITKVEDMIGLLNKGFTTRFYFHQAAMIRWFGASVAIYKLHL